MKILYIISVSILIAACSVHAPVGLDPIETPTYFKESIKSNSSNLKTDWWKNFNDKNLNTLVEFALKNNSNYKMSLKETAASQPGIQERIMQEKNKAAKLALISEVVTVYFQIATINKNIANLSRQKTIVNSLLKIANTQYAIGYIEITTLRDASIKENSIKNDIRNLKKQQKIYLNHLAELQDQYPEDFKAKIDSAANKTEWQNLLPPTIPAQMLADRPDIQIAQLEVAAFSNNQTEWFSGFLSSFSSNESPEDQYEQAVLNYKNTVHNAFQEVDDALLAFKEDQASLYSARTITNNASEDYKTANIQYKAGQIDYATYLSFELHLLQTEYELALQNL